MGLEHCLLILPINPFLALEPAHQIIEIAHKKDIVDGFGEIFGLSGNGPQAH